MFSEADLLTETANICEANIHSQKIRPKAGGELIDFQEEKMAAVPSSPLYCAPSNLILTPAPECRKLARGISRATDNEGIVWALRSGNDQTEPETLSNEHIFLMPDLGVYPTDLRTFIEKDLFETAALLTLESCGRLNWWTSIPDAPRLVPLVTSGDGNCLPHAASLAAWGFHDRLLALRTRLQSVLTSHRAAAGLRRRWRWSEAAQLGAAGLSPTECEWQAEWEGALAAASTTQRVPGHLQGLDALHVMALAVAMRRPIIVYADSILRDFKGEALAPIPFGGVYLPLELDPSECTKTPILLAYDAGHFSALVPSEPFPTQGALVPLEDASGEPLPIKFIVDPGEDFKWDQPVDQAAINRLLPDEYQLNAVLDTYLNIERVPVERELKSTNEFRKSCDNLSSSGKNKFVVKGKSKFYTSKEIIPEQSPPEIKTFTHKPVIRNIPITLESDRKDRTLYLSRSTFYDDRPPSPPQTVPNEVTRLSHGSHETATSTFLPNEFRHGTNGGTHFDDDPLPCKTPLCLYYGSPQYGQYCSSCYKNNK